jgi:hypothetical protein
MRADPELRPFHAEAYNSLPRLGKAHGNPSFQNCSAQLQPVEGRAAKLGSLSVPPSGHPTPIVASLSFLLSADSKVTGTDL